MFAAGQKQVVLGREAESCIAQKLEARYEAQGMGIWNQNNSCKTSHRLAQRRAVAPCHLFGSKLPWQKRD
jgi:hypothetical protein